ncbi:MAG: hypothetical protein RL088_2321 [Verrucomicrobiota bacterium]|jgi:hypothetical protein
MLILACLLGGLIWLVALAVWSATADDQLVFHKVIGWILSIEAIVAVGGVLVAMAFNFPDALFATFAALGLGSAILIFAFACLVAEIVARRR